MTPPGPLPRRDSVLALAMLVFPHGGQQTARRNAQQAVIADGHVARARSEASAAIRTAAAPKAAR